MHWREAWAASTLEVVMQRLLRLGGDELWEGLASWYNVESVGLDGQGGQNVSERSVHRPIR